MASVFCPVTVGRDDELAQLDEALAAVRNGRGGMVVLAGEAGIGKSRLAGEAENRARMDGMRVLRGRAVPGEAQHPFRALAEALHGAFRETGPPEVPELDAYRPLLGWVVPEWADRAMQPEPVPVVLEAVLRLLRVLARGDGLVLVLEDLHWADVETLAAVEYVVDNVGSTPILVLATSRSDTPGAGADRLDVLVTRRAATRMLLGPLHEEAVVEIARRSLDTDALPPAIAHALRKRAEGIPFLIEEILSAYVDAGGPTEARPEWWLARRRSLALPASYQELVGERLAALTDDGRGVVNAAAVLGRTFDWKLLSPVIELDEDQVLAALRDAVDAQLLVSAQTDLRSVSFRHALVREAVLAHLLPPERSALSLRAAEAIEDEYPGLPGEWCERAADLREEAGDGLGACRLLQESARRALARGALGTAEADLLHARVLAEGDFMVWMGVDELLVETLAATGKTERLVELATGLLEGWDRSISIGGVSARRVAQLHLNVTTGALLTGDLEIAHTSLAHAVEILGSHTEDVGISARATLLTAQLALAEGDASGARTHAERALEAGERLGFETLACEALDARARAALLADRREEAEPFFDELGRIASREDLTVWQIRALHALGVLDSERGANPARLLEARELAVASGAVSSLAQIDLELARHELSLAELEGARAALSRSLDACRRFRLRLLPDALLVEAMLHALEGATEEMDTAAAEVLDAAEGDPSVEAEVLGNGRAVLLLVREEGRRALEVLERAASLLHVAPGAPPWWLGLRALLGTTGAADARGAAADEPWVSSSVPTLRGYAAYRDAVLCGRQGLADEAAVAFERAESAMPQGWRRQHARRLVAEAAVADGWGEPASWAREALDFFQARELESTAAACRSILRRAGARVPRRGRGEAEVPPALRSLGVTSREMDVLLLVAEGLSNREIGERLFVSPRTVETHVRSLLRRSELSTRAQLVAFGGRYRDARSR